jgi:hypothetical protein
MNSQRRSFHHRGSRPNVAKVEMGDSTTNLFCFAGMNDSVVEELDDGVISPRLSPDMAMPMEEDQQSSSSSSSSRRGLFFSPILRKKSPPSSRVQQRSKSFQDIKLPSFDVSCSTRKMKANLKAPPPPEPAKLSTSLPLDHTNEDPVCDDTPCNKDWQPEQTSRRISIVPTSSSSSCKHHDPPLPPPPPPPPPRKYDRNADWQLRMVQEWESRQSCTSKTPTAETATTISSHFSNQQQLPIKEMDQRLKTLKSSLLADIVRPRPTESSRVPTTESGRTRLEDSCSEQDDSSADCHGEDAPKEINLCWDTVPAEYLPSCRATTKEQRFDIVGQHHIQKKPIEEEQSPPPAIEMIEVKAGHAVPLKGCEETWKAFCRGTVTETECSSCQAFLYCVATAKIVLCPCCHFLSPVVGVHEEEGQQHDDEEGDVGIGLTVEDVTERMSG